ncbi:MAG: hypothetical protein ACI4Q3_03670 [Kiritimatiellia bacterium]
MTASFLLAWRTLVRGRVLALLLAATALDHLFLPLLVRSNGTAEGWREMFVRVVPGSVFLVTALTLVACACGLVARDRERSRLALAVLRPASGFAVVLGRWFALCAVGALVLLLNAGLGAFRLSSAPRCQHHVRPAMPPVATVARAMLEDYLADPQTPEAVRKAPRGTVLELLANKELDRYDVIAAGQSMRWPFPPNALDGADRPALRARFATAFEMKKPLQGTFAIADFVATVTNSTQSVADFPLRRAASPLTAVAVADGVASLPLSFANTGTETVMLRPRRDLELLLPADAFGWNLLRASLQMFATLALLSGFGLFLSAALSRPVAVFTALVAIAVALMAPGVVEQFPDELGTTFANRLGLGISRFIRMATSLVTAADPVSDLATDTCIEWPDLFRCLLVNAGAVPLAFLSAASLLIRRKALPDHA